MPPLTERHLSVVWERAVPAIGPISRSPWYEFAFCADRFASAAGSTVVAAAAFPRSWARCWLHHIPSLSHAGRRDVLTHRECRLSCHVSTGCREAPMRFRILSWESQGPWKQSTDPTCFP
ncbi:hypothetical protein HPB50_004598 [Hyalomma asiaticum]|uniref:Uncharacterized protein n=1 Tax=Hyalomma asiaticum TaxID=266040 RepID=A0ACB7TC44_HYAAI|nr:hypothetical protein HPB50_004598 [Hyalomma asiaticum]